MLEIFNDNAFSTTSLTSAVNSMDFVPGRIGELGLFDETRITTTSVAIEEKNSSLILVPPTPRGGPGTSVGKGGRSMRNLSVPHFEINDTIRAEEVQNLREFGSESNVQALIDYVGGRMGEHSQSFTATEEHLSLGALKGEISYADGTSLSLFTEFGVSQETEVDFDLDNASPAEGALRKKCAEISRKISKNLRGTPSRGVHCFCGDTFFDQLLAHPEVRETYKGMSQAAILRDGYVTDSSNVYAAFTFGGIVFENYRGEVDETLFVEAGKAHFFPVGAPGFLKLARAPGDLIEAVNTLGQRLYARQYEMPNGKGVHLDLQMNALPYATKPKALMKAKNT